MSRHTLQLDVIDVEEPCPASWEGMAGDDRVRFCEGCGLHVYNLSAMSRDDAQLLVCANAGRLCVRFERTAEGAVQTLAYRTSPGRPTGRSRGWRYWTGFAAAAAALVAVVNFCVTGSPFDSPLTPRAPLMGAIAIPAVTPPMGPSTNAAFGGDSELPQPDAEAEAQQDRRL